MTEDFNITGTWVNRLTGDKVVVRNTIIDGDDMIIICADGRQLKMSEFQNYIQMSDEKSNGIDDTLSLGDIRGIENERRVIVGASNNYNAHTNDSYVINDEHPMMNNIINDYDPPKSNKEFVEEAINRKGSEKMNESEKMLSKLFEKIDLDVDLKINLNCSNFPVKELNMLQTIYDVTVDDISNYIIKNVLNIDVFKSAITEYVNEQLTN